MNPRLSHVAKVSWTETVFDGEQRFAIREIADLLDLVVRGEAGPAWQDWSPSPTGWTTGDGTVQARYRVDGNTLFWWFQFTLGSTSAIGTNPKVGIPSGWTVHNDGVNQSRIPGQAVAYDSSAGTFYSGVCYAGDAGDAVLTTRIIFNTATVTATAPFTWAAGDILMLSGTVEVQPT